MSTSGWFTCLDCRVTLWLGRGIPIPGAEISQGVARFVLPDASSICDAQGGLVARVVWQMFADHVRHDIVIQLDRDLAIERDLARIREIGGDTVDDVEFDDYLSGEWRRQPFNHEGD
jgi:hypothetical protein